MSIMKTIRRRVSELLMIAVFVGIVYPDRPLDNVRRFLRESEHQVAVKKYSQDEIEATAPHLETFHPRLLVWSEGDGFRVYNVNHKDGHYQENMACGRCAKTISLMVHVLTEHYGKRFQPGQPVFQMLWSDGDSFQSPCVNKEAGCNVDKFSPLPLFGSVPKDPQVLPTVKAMPNWFYIDCLYNWKFGVKSNNVDCWNEDVNHGVKWDELDPKVIWRGSDFTFLPNYEGHAGFFTPKVMEDFIERFGQDDNTAESLVMELFDHWHSLSPRWKAIALSAQAEIYDDVWIDAKFVGPVREKAHERFAERGVHVASTEHMTAFNMSSYKYQFDIGGGGGTSWRGTLTKLEMPGVLLHHETPTKDWWYDEMTEYKHYIPVSLDLSDLKAKVQWAERNEKRVKQISKAATELAHHIFSEAYMKKVFDELFVKYLGHVVDSYVHNNTAWMDSVTRYKRNGFSLTEIAYCHTSRCFTNVRDDIYRPFPILISPQAAKAVKEEEETNQSHDTDDIDVVSPSPDGDEDEEDDEEEDIVVEIEVEDDESIVSITSATRRQQLTNSGDSTSMVDAEGQPVNVESDNVQEYDSGNSEGTNSTATEKETSQTVVQVVSRARPIFFGSMKNGDSQVMVEGVEIESVAIVGGPDSVGSDDQSIFIDNQDDSDSPPVDEHIVEGPDQSSPVVKDGATEIAINDEHPTQAETGSGGQGDPAVVVDEGGVDSSQQNPNDPTNANEPITVTDSRRSQVVIEEPHISGVEMSPPSKINVQSMTRSNSGTKGSSQTNRPQVVSDKGLPNNIRQVQQQIVNEPPRSQPDMIQVTAAQHPEHDYNHGKETDVVEQVFIAANRQKNENDKSHKPTEVQSPKQDSTAAQKKGSDIHVNEPSNDSSKRPSSPQANAKKDKQSSSIVAPTNMSHNKDSSIQAAQEHPEQHQDSSVTNNNVNTNNANNNSNKDSKASTNKPPKEAPVPPTPPKPESVATKRKMKAATNEKASDAPTKKSVETLKDKASIARRTKKTVAVSEKVVARS